ncbi:glycosyl transferase family 1 [Thermosipho melanesiensis]|uniref:Glycosyl transferase, group 1 n=2 Tax=Thermosipho melanesiensis TaxID=46541 RepID=A6LP05_THEM4|nr:glycosyltransferase [Thermosipho melanesiensis]ABR31656.1 glycosyl transferase, group 1 [Thermosipho melanesiensis BI429]APT74683.1 glycosyl transferase family 1 [Thermosipho melanesiensis]OOC35181.1 glycosyl transferase family 1 [Thermosipho melanesiensis]OOC35391.1 glycosyl transferase family 1 [Thermosipho melanesiensis]OOC36642.1 glycosyl transferase family 1 [Thermosipho melanesiensis]
MKVKLPQKSIKDYEFISKNDVEELIELAKNLKNLKVIHVNATSYGGGVAELLYTLIPLMNNLGLNAQWEVLEAPMEFFNITKKIHNAFQGEDIELSEDELEFYVKINKENAEKLDLDADVVIIHDPQPYLIPMFKNGNYIWRCHIDTSSPNLKIWDKVITLANRKYKKALFHLKEYFQEPFKSIAVEFPPSIDPLSDKNRKLSENTIKEIVEKYGIDLNRPIITVVARFDPWKDLKSAINVYKILKERIDIQLLIVSAMAKDDPEGWILFEDILRYAGTDRDIHFLTDLKGVGHPEVNAFQTISTVGLHTATKEGFGLVISEMLWKGNPVVARPVGGINLQIIDGYNGFLRYNINELADAIFEIIKNSKLREEMGKNAKKVVKKHFLTTSHLKRYLKIISEVI